MEQNVEGTGGIVQATIRAPLPQALSLMLTPILGDNSSSLSQLHSSGVSQSRGKHENLPLRLLTALRPRRSKYLFPEIRVLSSTFFHTLLPSRKVEQKSRRRSLKCHIVAPSEGSKNMNLVIIILRFLGHIPTFWLAGQSTSVYHTVRKFPDLIQNAPGGANLRVSLHLLAIAVCLFRYGFFEQ